MTQPHTRHSDIIYGDWIDRRLPDGLRPYARLMRLDRPIGTWLLLLPCWWSLALASDYLPNIALMTLFAIGALLMRGAGCTINDMWDRDLDRQVERTKLRPLASGELTLIQAGVLLAVLLLFGFLVLIQFNALTVGIGLCSLLIVAVYPLAKRYVWWPQLVLGLAFNWGAWLGWSAVRDDVSWSALLLYVAGIFWTLAYDTMYAHQDKHDDALVGIKSLALKLGDKSRLWVAGFFDVMLFLILIAGWREDLGWPFYAVLACAYAHALWQLLRWKMNDPVSSLKKFRSNRDLGLIVFAAIILGKIV